MIPTGAARAGGVKSLLMEACAVKDRKPIARSSPAEHARQLESTLREHLASGASKPSVCPVPHSNCSLNKGESKLRTDGLVQVSSL